MQKRKQKEGTTRKNNRKISEAINSRLRMFLVFPRYLYSSQLCSTGN